MKPYRAVFSARFRTLLQYRASAVAGAVTQLFFGFVRVMVLYAFYQAATTPPPMDFEQVVSYTWLSQAMFLLTLYGADPEVRDMIRSGTVAYEMLRPVNLYDLWFVRGVALRTAPVLLRAAPQLIVASLFLGLQPPASAASGVLWVCSTVAALFLAAAIGTLITITMLWTLSGDGAAWLMLLALYFFSGLVLPVPLWPDWLQPLFHFLPFRGVIDTPVRIYIGHIPPNDAFVPIAHQLAWTLAFVLAGKTVLRRGVRRLVVQGG